ncbi:MAG: threonine--tRNA ligase [Candidatus Woykebacteria bacterium RIFCSPHIGHO2_12_FULL_45_10]|uniref:Threonine--tRNA ligase n=1 Tax=Candidatus Woykebacteria bacterium RIFCSPHIGHO2_12_FULL_45_10 TaxID=1802603 RepID=A0A1G1WPC8_9BACT|nr:MAG: threonine--tRNA ligase [Candidatus Woykebacteria bacterium RIFCSPHIGHO2_12_FULL_45_10]
MKNHSALEIMRHSTAHLLAAAVGDLFPKTKLGIGPTIENGFYYDFDFKKPLLESDLAKIEAKMLELKKKKTPYKKVNKQIDEAIKFNQEIDQPYKTELTQELKKSGETKASFYETGHFVDLCEGPHVNNSGEIGAFKLTSIAGAYWRGSEKNPMLTRIYGTAWNNEMELEEHLEKVEEAKRRDHRRLGQELEMLFFHPTAPGMPYFLPKGAAFYNQLLQFSREEHAKNGYQEIFSPLLNKKELFVTSGHWEHYLENMFVIETEEKETYGVKAMNCPNAMIVFGSKSRSYRDLPLRLFDADMLHRYERSGTLNGLFRVREFRQDDAHIFATEDQIKQEFRRLFELVEKFYSVFNLEYSFRLGTRPEKFLGQTSSWEKAEKILKEVLKASGKDHLILEGDGAFYGPKIDILMKDSLDRQWQMGTLQLDFQIPHKFGLKYTAEDGVDKTPVTIHRAIYGSFERFIGILIEHYGGNFPLWLSPVQVIIVPIADRHNEYAALQQEKLLNSGIRTEIDTKSATMQSKIRDAELAKIPYIFVLGDREVAQQTVTVRKRLSKDQKVLAVDESIAGLQKEIESKE